MKIFPIIGTKICTYCFTKNNIGEFENLSFEKRLKLSEEEEKKSLKSLKKLINFLCVFAALMI